MVAHKVWILLVMGLGLPLALEAQEVPRVTIDAEDRPLFEILKELGEQHGLNYVASRQAIEAAHRVYCHLKDIPLDRAVQMLAAACYLEAEVQGRYVVLRAPKDGQPPRLVFPSGAETRPPARTGAGTAPSAARPPALLSPPGQSAEKPAIEKQPAPTQPDESVTTTTIGKVVSVSKSGLVMRGEDGKSMSFKLPPDGSREGTFILQLRKALERLQPGHRVVVIASRDSQGVMVIESVIGGRDPRDKSTVTLPPAKKSD